MVKIFNDYPRFFSLPSFPVIKDALGLHPASTDPPPASLLIFREKLHSPSSSPRTLGSR